MWNFRRITRHKFRHGWPSHKIETNYVVPAGLRGVTGMGCRVLSWDGNKVSMICYLAQGTNHVDLFIAEKKRFQGAVPGDKPQFVTIGTNATASWSQMIRSICWLDMDRWTRSF